MWLVINALQPFTVMVLTGLHFVNESMVCTMFSAQMVGGLSWICAKPLVSLTTCCRYVAL